MRFAFIAKNKRMLSIERLCRIMGVSPRGYRAFRSRPLSQNQRKDMGLELDDLVVALTTAARKLPNRTGMLSPPPHAPRP